jgi:hypothetical protein
VGGGAWRGPSKARRSTTETPAAAAQTLDHEPQPLKPQTPYPPARSLWGTAAARRRRCATPSTPPWQVGVGSGRGGGLVQHNRKAAQASVLPLRREGTHPRGDAAADKGHRPPRDAPAAAAGLRHSQPAPAPLQTRQTTRTTQLHRPSNPTHNPRPTAARPQASSWLPPATRRRTFPVSREAGGTTAPGCGTASGQTPASSRSFRAPTTPWSPRMRHSMSQTTCAASCTCGRLSLRGLLINCGSGKEGKARLGAAPQAAGAPCRGTGGRDAQGVPLSGPPHPASAPAVS